MDINSEIRTAYLMGFSHKQIQDKFKVGQYEVARMVNSLVDDYPKSVVGDRLEQARLMESNIFQLISKKENVSHLINSFAAFCA